MLSFERGGEECNTSERKRSQWAKGAYGLFLAQAKRKGLAQ